MKDLSKTIDIIKYGAELSEYYYHRPIVITFSGGKDSTVLLEIAKQSGIKYEINHSVTTVDAPQTNKYVNEVFAEESNKGIICTKHIPKINMWKLINKNGMPPTRLARYCCKEFKETTLPNRVIGTGIRKDESSSRKTRKEIEIRNGKIFDIDHSKKVFMDAKEIQSELHENNNSINAYDCPLIANAKENNDIIINPLLDWSESEIWEFIRGNGIKYNPLYDMGYFRVGCIGCPMLTYKQRMKQFGDFPEYRERYIKAFEKMVETRKAKGLSNTKEWETGEDVFNWWVEDPNIKGQIDIESYLKESRSKWLRQ